jgi:hypothetical protein
VWDGGLINFFFSCPETKILVFISWIVIFLLLNKTWKWLMSPLQKSWYRNQRSIWEGDQELVKRSGRHELIWVVIHLCMKAWLGISLCGYPYLN